MKQTNFSQNKPQMVKNKSMNKASNKDTHHYPFSHINSKH